MRAQGYNGDTNMQREINGLKTLILQDNPSANCTHCFSQPLHFTFVTVAKRQCDVGRFFAILTFELNVIGAYFERQTISQENQDEKLKELLNFGKVLTWRDSSQKYEFERLGDAPLESHFKALLSVITIFSSVVHVLEVIASLRSPERIWAEDLLEIYNHLYAAFYVESTGDHKGVGHSFTKKRSRNCKCDETCWHDKETISNDERW